MGAFKEELYMVSQFAERQRQIYADAFDYGVYLKDSDVVKLREAVQELRKYCHTKPVIHIDGMTGSGTCTEVYVGQEEDEGMVSGVYITITSWKQVNEKVYFTINMENRRMTLNSFEATKVLP